MDPDGGNGHKMELSTAEDSASEPLPWAYGKQRDPLTERVIGCAIEVHRHLGPGLLESAYETALCYELNQAGFAVRRQVPLPVRYKDIELVEAAYRIDVIVQDQLVLELKTVEKLLPVHEAQLLTYLRLSGIRKGLLINFLSPVIRSGIKRMVI